MISLKAFFKATSWFHGFTSHKKSLPLLFQQCRKGWVFFGAGMICGFQLTGVIFMTPCKQLKKGPWLFRVFVGDYMKTFLNISKAEWCSASLKVTLSSPNMISCVKSTHKTVPRWFRSRQDGTFDHIHPLASFVEKDAVDVWQHDILPSKDTISIFALESSDGRVMMMKGEGWYNSLLG